jgi:hypothetical protein
MIPFLKGLIIRPSWAKDGLWWVDDEKDGSRLYYLLKFVENFYYGKKGRSYRNIKTGDIYQVSDITRDSEDPSIERVCYSRNGQQSWDRPLDLFIEKFEEV